MASKTMTRWVVALTAIGSLMAALDTLVVSTALNRIRLDLGASLGQLEWTVSAYNLSFAVLLITGAALGDRYGRRNLFAVGLGLFAAASAAAALAPDVGALIGGAVVEGISWPWIFWINVPIGLVTIPLVLTRMRERHGPDASLDIRGLVLVTGACSAWSGPLFAATRRGGGAPR